VTSALETTVVKNSPWPDRHGAPLLFVIVGEDDAERRLLREWIAATKPAGAGDAAIAEAILDDEDAIAQKGLDGVEAREDDLVVAPVGVRWIPEAPRGARAKLKEILAIAVGAPKDPARKEKLFREKPERWAKIAGEPASLAALKKRFRRHSEDQGGAAFARFIAAQAALTVDREYRRLLGVDIKLPRFAVPTIMADRDFRRDLEAVAQLTGRPFADVEADARKCLKEIAPAPTPFFVAVMGWITRSTCSMGYSPKIVVNEARAKDISDLVRRSPTAFLFTHKSHVDGMAMINFAHERRLPLLHPIGGDNMAFAGVGAIAKKSGTIFIRRSFQDDPVYKTALRHYLAYALEKRFPVAWSLEGTRSRIGKLMPPRYGILKYVLEAARRNGLDDLKIVPVSIYYDLIPEIDSYATEQAGADKRKESLAWFIGFVAGMRKPLGRIFMDFGAPITAGAGPADGEAFAADLHRIAFDAAVNVNAVTPLTASGVISFIIISAAPQALTRSEIVADLIALKEWAKARAIPMTEDFDDAERANLRLVAQSLTDVGVLKRHDEGLEPIYSIASGQQFSASYYRNTVVHFFVNNAIIELALAYAMTAEPGRAAEAFWNEVLDLRDLFKFEFFYPARAQFEAEIRAELGRQNPNFDAMLKAGGDSVERLLEGLSPLFAHGALKPYVEAYSVVADAILRLKPGEAASEKEIVASCLKLGREAVLRRRISGEESIAKFLFANGYKAAAARGVVDADARELSGRRVAFARDMKDVQRRLRLIEAIAARRRVAHEFGPKPVEAAPLARSG